ncbi:ECF transporter S component [Sporosarcina sp. P26b]|uniref:ECF transporter S component n=1 Tax=Sporosarcina sp. P26b TaxID=2048253 RepID=UPI000C16F9F1|nr:ECF transporter S component [Sporosarcina sp. P26b]PIC96248.1 ECF transporter S component [Sporosarcina sp. P26b]
MGRSRKYLLIVSVILLALLVISIVFFHYKAYLLLSMIMIAAIMIPFFARFEWRDVGGREVVLLAMMAAIAAVGRVPFAGLPSIQPTSFIIIMAGLVFGAESGFIVGAVAAIVSNFFLGQGPWTPWQMYGWGMMGMTAGLLRNTSWMKTLWGKCTFGFIWGYIFGWIMNMWVIVGNIESLTWSYVVGIFVSSVYFDLAHAVSNVFFIVVFSASWMKILRRIQGKYGLLQEQPG